MNNRKIVVIGSSNVDLIMKVERLPRPGETVTGGTFFQTYGGKGANQAVGAVRSGGNVNFISCLGDDDFAPACIKNFRKDGLGIAHISQAAGVATGTALIMIDSKGENCISVAPGANNELLPSHIDAAESLFEQAEIILLQCEMRPETRDYIIQKGASLGKRVVLNLAPARPIDPERLSELHLLIVNESEAEFLSKKNVDSLETAKSVAHQLSKEHGIGIILTMGKQGSYYAQGIEGKFVPAFPVEAIDTTAAGDVFCGSLATALVEGLAITEAIRFASAAAAIAVTRLGAQPSAPLREEIDEFLAEREIQ